MPFKGNLDDMIIIIIYQKNGRETSLNCTIIFSLWLIDQIELLLVFLLSECVNRDKHLY